MLKSALYTRDRPDFPRYSNLHRKTQHASLLLLKKAPSSALVASFLFHSVSSSFSSYPHSRLVQQLGATKRYFSLFNLHSLPSPLHPIFALLVPLFIPRYLTSTHHIRIGAAQYLQRTRRIPIIPRKFPSWEKSCFRSEPRPDRVQRSLAARDSTPASGLLSLRLHLH